jgi:RNA polymerase sigma-70 factor, ECF subfamily
LHDFEHLYDIYFDEVYYYLIHFSGNQSEAEDLTQETFIKILSAYKRFDHNSSIKTWIFSIARHTAIDYYRKKKMISLLPDMLHHLTTNVGNPEGELDHIQDWEILQHALLKLKPDYRNVVIFRGLKEYSIKETAAILSWKESKVKVDYHRAIKLLKAELHKSNEGMVMLREQ